MRECRSVHTSAKKSLCVICAMCTQRPFARLLVTILYVKYNGISFSYPFLILHPFYSRTHCSLPLFLPPYISAMSASHLNVPIRTAVVPLYPVPLLLLPKAPYPPISSPNSSYLHIPFLIPTTRAYSVDIRPRLSDSFPSGNFFYLIF
jgi:hypothetical protein